MSGVSLETYLESTICESAKKHSDVRSVIQHLASAATKVRDLINQGALGSAFAGTRGGENTDGDLQKDLDIVADEIFLNAMRHAPIAVYGSEELDNPVLLDPDANLALAIDPLDGSSNIDTNVSIGSIFSILPVTGDVKADPLSSFLQPGKMQHAAGFFIYGPQLALILSLGSGTEIFVYSSRLGEFIQAYSALTIPSSTREFAINASNFRHWEEPIKVYIDDCLSGAKGPREQDFNMRWVASLVADTYRILVRGGIFLYPQDKRKGYRLGRLRLVYEANPIAMLVEQAGGLATDTSQRILDICPDNLHQRTPLVFGSENEVARVERYHRDTDRLGERSPLFGNRGLFRV